MASTIILSDNGASSGSAGLKQTAGNDGVLILQTTTSGGTATNAVYVNNSQNVGFRTTPAAWGATAKAIQVGARGSLFEYGGTTTDVMNNGYFDGTNYVYLETATAAFHRMATGRHQLYSAASGTAGTAITWTNVLQVEKDYSLALQGGTSSAGTGIAFPATQSASSDANTLDDYEEGTWSPTLGCSGCTFTYSQQQGWYVKIGRFIWVGGTVAVNGTTGTSANTNTVYINFPFTAAGGQTNEVSTLVVGYRVGFSVRYPNAGFISNGLSTPYLVYNDPIGASVYVQGQHITNTTYLDFSMAYEANA